MTDLLADVTAPTKPYLPRESKSSNWETPTDLFDELNLEFGFTLDAAASDDNALCDDYYTREQDGAIQRWAGHTVFVNPPYDHKSLTRFMDKALAEMVGNGVTTVLLYPAHKTDQKWWHKLWRLYLSGQYKIEIRWVKGRLTFGLPPELRKENEKAEGATFPNVVIVVAP